MSEKAIWILTKDLRLHDNRVLRRALYENPEIYPTFVFDEAQFERGGPNSIHFLLDCLVDLNDQIPINFVEKNKFDTYIRTENITKAYILRGYTDFEKSRNQTYDQLLELIEIDDVLGCPFNLLLKKDRTAYQIYRYFYRNAPVLDQPDMTVNFQKKLKGIKKYRYDFEELRQYCPPHSPKAQWLGGETEALRIVKEQGGPISPHVKFGSVSPRVVYHMMNKKEEIMWRAMYYVLVEKKFPLKPITPVWSKNRAHFRAWTTGRTGYDIVDAGITELVQTGFMDNKARMVVANFLVFVLGIDWREGEKFFRYYLVDYDWPLNLGNWAWCAQVGIDRPRPNPKYDNKSLRIFNPDSYSKDKKDYIKKWLKREKIPKIVDYEESVQANVQYY